MHCYIHLFLSTISSLVYWKRSWRFCPVSALSHEPVASGSLIGKLQAKILSQKNKTKLIHTYTHCTLMAHTIHTYTILHTYCTYTHIYMWTHTLWTVLEQWQPKTVLFSEQYFEYENSFLHWTLSISSILTPNKIQTFSQKLAVELMESENLVAFTWGFCFFVTK